MLFLKGQALPVKEHTRYKAISAWSVFILLNTTIFCLHTRATVHVILPGPGLELTLTPSLLELITSAPGH